jgi:replicative DNA helicase
MSKDINFAILESLTNSLDFTRKVLPFLKEEYFQSQSDKEIFKLASTFFEKYDALPTPEILKIELNSKPLAEAIYNSCIQTISEFESIPKNLDWLITSSEKFCRDRAIYNAIMQSIHIMDGKENKLSKDSIPGLLEEALAIGFDNSIGHDYFADAEERFDFYTKVETKIPFDIDMLNLVTKGGYSFKTLNIVAAATNVGKSIFGCSYAASCLSLGHNVLYITLEMAEEKIAERIDANLLNIDIDEIPLLGKDTFMSRLDKIKQKTNGRLIVKEYPTGEGHAGHFATLLNELRLKESFIPKVIVIDYLNICASKKLTKSSENSNTLVKHITEELRALAIKSNTIILTFTQFNRGGMQSSDNELTDTADSIGATFTVDSYFAMNEPEDLAKQNQIVFKQLKNRYSDKNKNKRFIVGLDKPKMKFYNVEEHSQTLVNSNLDKQSSIRIDSIQDKFSKQDKFKNFK